MSYDFRTPELERCRCGRAMLILHTLDRRLVLRISLTPEEADAFGHEIEGELTLRARMGATLLLLIERIGGDLRSIRLGRSLEERLEAALVLELGGEAALLPANPGDALSLALSLSLPIEGESSLQPWMRPLDAAADEAVLDLPIREFLRSLPDLPAK